MSSDEDRAKEILKGFKLYPFCCLFGDVLLMSSRSMSRSVSETLARW